MRLFSAIPPVAALLAFASHESGQPAVQGAPRRVVTVVASDHSFQAPDTVPEGLTTFQMDDRGPTDHQLVIFKLADSVSLNEFYAAMSKGGASPPGIRSLGGAQEGEMVSILLRPGRHVFACLHGFDDGSNHLTRGMFRAFTVVASTARTAAPRFDATVTLKDHGFTVSGNLKPGRRMLRIANTGPQEHHVMIQQLMPGRTLADVQRWQEGGRKGERPVKPIFFGTTRQSPGEILYAEIEVAEGGYILLCLVPDVRDGKPHVEHGMRGEIRVSN